jgi:hypothetical protein
MDDSCHRRHLDEVGREGSVEVIGFHHEVHMPTDPDTGVLTGVRMHEAFQIVRMQESITMGDSNKINSA